MRKLWILLPLLSIVLALIWRLGGAVNVDELSAPLRDEARVADDVGALDAPTTQHANRPVPTRKAIVAPIPDAQLSSAARDTGIEPPESSEAEPTYPDPLETGDCALFVEVYDLDSQSPIASSVHLWRLEAPENEHWNAGAQRQSEVHVGVEGSWIRDLPAGRYRALCVASRRNGDDPLEFNVSGATTRIRLGVEMPREREVMLRLYTADGALIRSADVRFVVKGANHRSVKRPDWATPRTSKHEPTQVRFGVGGGYSGSRRSSPRRLQADAEGWFHIGVAREGDRRSTSNYRMEAQHDSLTPLIHYFDGDEAELRFVSVLIDPTAAEQSVLTPEGLDCTEIEDRMRVTSSAVPYDPDAVDVWRSVPIEAARRWGSDYEDLEFRFTIDELPLPTRVLVAKPVRDE